MRKLPANTQWVAVVDEMKPSFYLDEDVPPVYAQVLEKNGFLASTTAQLGRLGISDAAQLTYCIDKGFVLITHNLSHFRDLADLVLASGGHHPGVIGIHQVDRHGRAKGFGQVADRLIDYVKHKDPIDLRDTFQVIT